MNHATLEEDGPAASHPEVLLTEKPSSAQAEEETAGVLLSVIIPARDEANCIGKCLHSLVAQSDSLFQLGQHWEILVVDDGSTDGTRAVAEDFSGIVILEAPRLERGWTGKTNACWSGAQKARGEWLLFTNAETVHQQGNLRRAIFEAERAKAGMLSYAPRQVAPGFWQSSLMPLIFSELALAYPPDKVSNPEFRLAMANSAFLLISRAAYKATGGHAGVADSILEDRDLAYLAKRRKVGLRYRAGADALSAYMLQGFREMCEGWTRKLALLFSNCLITAAWRLLDLALLAGLPLLALAFWHQPISRWAFLLLWARTLWRYYSRVRKSEFSALDCCMSIFALPLFAFLLWRSWFQHTVVKQVSWKGRQYPV